MKIFIIGIYIFSLITSQQAIAHHAFAAEFDGNKPVHLKGTVTKMEWINPHSWLHVSVKDSKGSITIWKIEAGSPNTLFRRGFTKESLKTGTEITVDGFQSKHIPNVANGRDVRLPDGRQVFFGSVGTGAPDDKNRKDNP